MTYQHDLYIDLQYQLHLHLHLPAVGQLNTSGLLCKQQADKKFCWGWGLQVVQVHLAARLQSWGAAMAL